MPSDNEGRVVDFNQMRTNALADALRSLVEHVKVTNNHVERLTRELAELRSDLGQFRNESIGRFDRIVRDIADLRSEQLLQANQILNAQQAASQVMFRLEAILTRQQERPGEG
jgi:hypothetical protein